MPDESMRRNRRAGPKGRGRGRRPLVLAALIGAAALVLLLVVSPRSGDGPGRPASGQSGSRSASAPPQRPLRLTAQVSPVRLPTALSGEAVVPRGAGLLSIGGLDSAGVSTSSILEFTPGTATIRGAGSLSEPLHDAASAAADGSVLVFGGGSATTIDGVERLTPGRGGEIVGHLPQARSDLSALTVRGMALVLGGYDGVGPVGSVLETRDGRNFTTIAQLPVAVRYASVAARGNTVFVIGGSLPTEPTVPTSKPSIFPQERPRLQDVSRLGSRTLPQSSFAVASFFSAGAVPAELPIRSCGSTRPAAGRRTWAGCRTRYKTPRREWWRARGTCSAASTPVGYP